MLLALILAAGTGLSTQQARTAAPQTIDGTNTSSAEGSSLSFARSDHQHATTYTASGGVARSLAAKLGDIVSVKDFGARGDGATDDTSAVQAAINSIPASTATQGTVGTGGGTVYFPPGVYLVTGITLRSGVHLFGASPEGSILRATANGQTMVYSGQYVQRIGISRMTLDANGKTGIVAVDLNGSQYGEFVDLKLSAPGSGIAFRLRTTTDGIPGTNVPNNTFNRFHHIHVAQFAQAFTLDGDYNGSHGGFTTLNDFEDILYDGPATPAAYEFKKNADTNYFRNIRNGVTASASAKCLLFNSASPTTDQDIQWEQFYGLTCESFGATAGTVGIQFNQSQNNIIRAYLTTTSGGGGITSIATNGKSSGQIIEEITATGSFAPVERMGNNTGLYFRNGTDTADILGMSITTGNILVIGQSGTQTTVQGTLVGADDWTLAAGKTFGLGTSTFASLPSGVSNGRMIYCTDCNATCTAGGGTGRTCFRENGAWTH